MIVRSSRAKVGHCQAPTTQNARPAYAGRFAFGRPTMGRLALARGGAADERETLNAPNCQAPNAKLPACIRRAFCIWAADHGPTCVGARPRSGRTRNAQRSQLSGTKCQAPGLHTPGVLHLGG